MNRAPEFIFVERDSDGIEDKVEVDQHGGAADGLLAQRELLKIVVVVLCCVVLYRMIIR